MPRHPYTHSCDFIRSACPANPPISRSDASQIRKAIAEALGMTNEELAVILSNRFQELTKDPEWVMKQTTSRQWNGGE